MARVVDPKLVACFSEHEASTRTRTTITPNILRFSTDTIENNVGMMDEES